jgi:uncharacterized repeat protein (TIGR02543 family)
MGKKLQKGIMYFLIVAIIAVVSFAAQTASAAWSGEGDGSHESPLLIDTADRLLEFKELVMNEDASLCAELTTDIDLTIDSYADYDWTVIGVPGASTAGDSTTPYTGVFNGGGYELKIASDNKTQGDPTGNVSLFHTIETTGKVMNLKLNVNFDCHSYVAGVARTNYGTIEDVTVSGSIKGVSGKAGGICVINGKKTVGDATVYGKIRRCINEANIIISSGTYVAGIAPYFTGYMISCANKGDVQGYSDKISGLANIIVKVGTHKIPSNIEVFQIIDSYNVGKIIATNANAEVVGLLSGSWNDMSSSPDALVSNVFSYGEVSSDGNNRLIIATGGDEFLESHANAKFKNVYYLEGCGVRLFQNIHFTPDTFADNIHSKTADEFKSADLAAALNGNRTGEDAPWEYVEGSAYPTLKFERTGAPTEAYELTVLAGTMGGSVEGDGRYAEGEDVTVTATPSAGYRFDRWETDDLTLTDEEKTANPLTFTMPANAVTLTAKFAANGGGGGGGTTPPGDEAPANIDAYCGSGGAITYSGGAFKVTAAGGYVIEAISVDGVQLSDVQGLAEFTIEDAPERSIFATFAPAPTTPPAGDGNGSGGNGSGELPAGDGSDLPAQSNSSGCDIGFGVISLLAAGAVMSMRGRKRA